MSSKAIRFFHTADIHFGVENYGRIDPETGIHTRLLDFEKSLSLMIDQAISEEIDLFVFSGDAYKTPYPTPTQQKLLLKQFLRLYSAKIPAVIIVGNHDHPLSFGRAHALDLFGSLPVDGFYVFGRPGVAKIKTKSGDVQIVGIPWPMRNNILAKGSHQAKSSTEITEYISEQVGRLISQYASKLDKTLPAILAGHLTVSSGIFSGSEKKAVFGTDPLFLPSQLAIEPFDYVALGHLHRHQNLNKSGNIPVVYSGSPERVDFGERKEPKGFCDVVIKNKQASYQFCELPVRPMKQIELTLSKELDPTEQVLGEIKKFDLTNAIIKVKYHVPEGVRDTVDIAQVQKACKNAHYLTGIVPVHTVITRSVRAKVSASMSPDKLLDKYFATQSFEKEEEEALRRKAHQVLDAIAQEEERGDEAFESD